MERRLPDAGPQTSDFKPHDWTRTKKSFSMTPKLIIFKIEV
jgi:hypothetical protein